MELLDKVETIFSEQELSRLKERIGAAGDIFEYTDLNKDDIIRIINCFFSHIRNYKDNSVIEELLNVCLRIMEGQNVFSGFDLESLLPCLHTLNDECSSYIITFLGFSGDMKYKKYIEEFLTSDSLKSAAEDALQELCYRNR